jgi:hypothetical protein
MVKVSSLLEFENLQAGAGDIVYFSSHGLNPAEGLSESQIQFFESVKRAGPFPIFWSWHERLDLLNQFFGHRWILTGELYRAQSVLYTHRAGASILSEHPNSLPTRFAASFVPDLNSQYNYSNRFLLATYIGARYHVARNAYINLRFRRIKIRYTPPFLDETLRFSRFFQPTKVVMGWHSTANISNGTIGERVYEGLAHGAVVVTDNPYAEDATDGHVVFVSDSSDLVELLARVKVDVSWWTKKSQSGINWAKDHGTYAHVASDFIRMIESFG